MGILNADGDTVTLAEYNSEQTKLMAAYMKDVLEGELNSGGVDEQIWNDIDTVRHNGLQAVQAAQNVSRHSTLSYIIAQWSKRFAPIVGPLARIDHQPLESVLAETHNYQTRIAQSMNALRLDWAEKTHQVLPMHTAFEQIRWRGPDIKFIAEFPDEPASPGDYFLAVDALFPHVQQNEHGVDLLFDANHISPQTLRILVDPAHVEELEKDLAKYG